MSLEFEGNFEVDNSPEYVYDFLTDPEKFAPVLPEFQDLEVNGDDDRECTIKVMIGVSHIQGEATVDLELVEEDPPKYAKYEGTGSIVAGSVDLTAEFEIEGMDTDGTRVHWFGEPEISGRIVSIAGGLLKPFAQKNIEKAIDRISEAIES